MDTPTSPPDALARIRPPVRLGDRLTVRHRLPDSSATDVIGFLDGLAAETVTMITMSGASVVIDRARIIAARRIPPARGGPDPRRTSADELQWIAAPAWLDASQRLGDWILRSADGFTRRANSALAVGDPGRPIDESAAQVIAYYRERRLPALAQTVQGSPITTGLEGLGWRPGGPDTDMMVARLAVLLERCAAQSTPDVASVEVAEQPSIGWLRALLTQRGADPTEIANPSRAVRSVIAGRPPVAFAALDRSPGAIAAIGRGHLNGDWLGVAGMWTDPGHRRRGYATMIIDALGRWAARRGARNVYLQVESDNARARAVYERLGFVGHHRYRYLLAPGPEDQRRR